MTECNDKNCPAHGSISVRGSVLTGKVISARPDKTVTVERKIIEFVPKFERYKKVRSRVHAHNPKCINAREGDIVKIGETKKISKTKNFVVLEKVSGKK